MCVCVCVWIPFFNEVLLVLYELAGMQAHHLNAVANESTLSLGSSFSVGFSVYLAHPVY